MNFVLVGQPNCGKSTIFNYVVGYKSVASNFPGITVEFTKGELEINDTKVTVIDLPGTYSLQTSDEAESITVKFLLELDKNGSSNIIINIIDASVLSRSLELTLQLLELKKPMIVVLNMNDEAEKKGIKIDEKKLSSVLGVPVVKSIGRKGIGVYELFDTAYEYIGRKPHNKIIRYSAIIEKTIRLISEEFSANNIDENRNYRFLCIKLFEKDKSVKEYLKSNLNGISYGKVMEFVDTMEKMLEAGSDYLISSARHSTSVDIFEEVATVGSRDKKDFRDKIDDFFMHPLFGYISLAVILYASFWIIFKIGNFLEPIFIDNIESLTEYTSGIFGEDSFWASVFNGLITGFGGGLGIVIPYLLPFFILLSFLEDSGYLARIAYLTDNLMHRIGLHGLSIVPMIFGYGCTVPAILATRIMKSPRDKFLTATLTTLVPCSARMTVIFGLVGFFISVKAAVMIYVINVIVIGLLGKLISKVLPEVSPGLLMEIPKYHLPSPKSVLSKTWFRLKEFVYVALPLLIVGSIILEIINHFEWADSINNFLAPFTNGLLGMPVAVGITLLFGIMRKELALILLFSALGTYNVLEVMTLTQIFSFTVFVTFYIPCLATYAALAKELNYKKATAIMLLSIVLATVLALIFRITEFFL